MKIVKPQATLIPYPSYDEMPQHIERIARLCYKSEDKITDTSAEKMITNLIKNGHEAMLEHGTIITRMPSKTYEDMVSSTQVFEECYGFTNYLRFTHDASYIVSGNIRAWRDWLKQYAECSVHSKMPYYSVAITQRVPIFFSDLKEYEWNIDPQDMQVITPNGLDTPFERMIHIDRSVDFVTDRGITHEIVRHRPASFAQESTRYCNYSKGKFGGEITVIQPDWVPDEIGSDTATLDKYLLWRDTCLTAEKGYMALLHHGASAQMARGVLPTHTKAEIVMTTNIKEWNHFFGLRCAPDAHPQMQQVALMANHRLWSEYDNLVDAYE